MSDRFLTEDEWIEEFKPGEALEDFPAGTDPKFLWTELDSDGHWSLGSGNYFVNRTGRYYVTEKSHNYDVFVQDEE